MCKKGVPRSPPQKREYVGATLQIQSWTVMPSRVIASPVRSNGEKDMGFEQFGVVSFTGSTKAAQFVDYLRNNELCGTICMRC